MKIYVYKQQVVGTGTLMYYNDIEFPTLDYKHLLSHLYVFYKST